MKYKSCSKKIAELNSNKPRVMEEIADTRGDYLMRAVLLEKEPLFEEPKDDNDFSASDLDDMMREYQKTKGMTDDDSEEGESSEEDEATEEGEDSLEEDTDNETLEEDTDSTEEMGEESEGENEDEVEATDEVDTESSDEEKEAVDAKTMAPTGSADNAITGSTGDSAHATASAGSEGHAKEEL
mmetsp:Transcript_90621/g.180241  ORF Transcript_90621/g.180241 Transcript_90621/m.180241 type:complete len:184 (-) Transcript_90621:103-654(-)